MEDCYLQLDGFYTNHWSLLIQLLTGGSSVLNHRILRRSQGDERYPSSLVRRGIFGNSPGEAATFAMGFWLRIGPLGFDQFFSSKQSPVRWKFWPKRMPFRAVDDVKPMLTPMKPVINSGFPAFYSLFLEGFGVRLVYIWPASSRATIPHLDKEPGGTWRSPISPFPTVLYCSRVPLLFKPQWQWPRRPW